MIAIECGVGNESPESRLLLTVHDERVLEVPETDVEPVAALVKKEVEGVASLAVPLEVEVGWGTSWYDAKG
jgi:DNA polymerase-1